MPTLKRARKGRVMQEKTQRCKTWQTFIQTMRSLSAVLLLAELFPDPNPCSAFMEEGRQREAVHLTFLAQSELTKIKRCFFRGWNHFCTWPILSGFFIYLFFLESQRQERSQREKLMRNSHSSLTFIHSVCAHGQEFRINQYLPPALFVSVVQMRMQV